MTNMFKISSIAIVGLLVAPVAFAQDAEGTVATVSKVVGDDATVVVIRDADAYALETGDGLFEGDRVIVRTSSTVEITGADCTVSLEESQSLTLSSNLCDDEVAFLAVDAPLLAGGAVGSAAPLWSLFAASAGTTAAAADVLTNGNTPTEEAPIVAENPTQSTSP